DLGTATFFLPIATADVGLAEFFSSWAGLRIAFDVVALACAGGLFVVPLSTAIQADAAPDRRARIVGGVNILNAAFIVFGVLATAVLQSRTIGVTEPVLLAALGVLNLGAAFYVRKSAMHGAT